MFPRTILLVGLLAGGLLLPAAGQTFTADQTPPYDPLTYHTEAVYGVGNIDFNNTTGSGTNPYGVTPDFKVTGVILADGTQVEVLDICAEMFVGPTGASTYDISSGFGTISADRADAARTLLSNTLEDFLFARAGLSSDDPNVVGAAIQIAFWEIAEDPVSFSNLSLDPLGSSPGDLSIIDFASGYSGATADAVSLAESYLANIRSGTWTNEGGFNYYYADAATEQDRLWITTGINTIPEPSTTLLGLIGGLLLLRRRR